MNPAVIALAAAAAGSAILVAWVWIAERLDRPQPGPAAGPGGGQHTARPGADEKPVPDLGALTPGPVGTGWLVALPDDDPADTTSLDAAHFLGMTTGQYVEKLFDQHAKSDNQWTDVTR